MGQINVDRGLLSRNSYFGEVKTLNRNKKCSGPGMVFADLSKNVIRLENTDKINGRKELITRADNFAFT